MATLRTLECLVALVEAGSMTGAAAKLHMTQPALSHQIASLERELGTPVVERLSRGVRVTPAGAAVAEEGRVALRAARDAVHIGRRVGAGDGGRLRIACAETMTAWLLVPVLREWCARRPGVALDLGEHTSADAMAELVAAGGADLAIGPRPTATDLPVEVLGEEEVVVVAPTGHEFARRPSVSIRDLAAEPFVHYDRGNGLAVWVDQLAAENGVVFDPVLRTRSPRTAAQLAAAGMGVAIVPVSALASRPAGVVRRLRPLLRREVVVVVGSSVDALSARFVSDLRRRGLPSSSTLS